MKIVDIPDFEWDWLKKKCKNCWELNKDRKNQRRWNSFYIKTCKKHTKTLQELSSRDAKIKGEQI